MSSDPPPPRPNAADAPAALEALLREHRALEGEHATLKQSAQRLTERSARLTAGLTLLTRIAGLTRAGDDLRATACAVLTGVTAGVGLGMNRALVLFPVVFDCRS